MANLSTVDADFWVFKLPTHCLDLVDRISRNRSVIYDYIVQANISNPESIQNASCTSQIMANNPEFDYFNIDFTTDCVNRSHEWNYRDDSLMYLKLEVDPSTQKLIKALTYILMFVLMLTMITLGCEIKVEDLKNYIKKRPALAMMAMFSQYSVMPLSSYVICRFLKLSFYPSIALIICGSCPGGNISNIFTYFAEGDLNLSILMTTFSSFFGLILMPLMINFYGERTKQIFEADPASQVQLNIPYTVIITQITFTIICFSIGIFLAHRYRNHTPPETS